VQIDDRTSALAGDELQPGERLLWSGQPDGKRIFLASDVLFLIPFGLVWTGASSVAAAQAFASGRGGGGLFAMSFVLIGIQVSFGRIFARTWVRRRTLYAVSDRRILALVPGWRGARHTSSVWLASHPPVDKRVGRDGRGTVWVGYMSDQQRQREAWGWQKSGGSAVAFLDIPEADGVARLIARRLGELRVAG